MVATGAGAEGTRIAARGLAGSCEYAGSFSSPGARRGQHRHPAAPQGDAVLWPAAGGSPAQEGRVTEEGDWWGGCAVPAAPREARPGAALLKRLSEACETPLLSARGRRPSAAPPRYFQSSPVALLGFGLRYPCRKTAGLNRELCSCARGRETPGSAGVPS